mmetsp:Transcript_23807/g.79124  ORF Transcript_23807/g.79124 Transcript_23807/m.79124 type:complete len:208 (+) Transcript_23807:235-858(+)
MTAVCAIRADPIADDVSRIRCVTGRAGRNRALSLKEPEEVDGRGEAVVLRYLWHKPLQVGVHGDLQHAVHAVAVEGWRAHQKDGWLGGHALEDRDERPVVALELAVQLWPLPPLRVVGAEHEHDDVRVGGRGAGKRARVPVGVVPLSQEGGAPDAEVGHPVRWAEHPLQLVRVALSAAREVARGDAVADGGHGCRAWERRRQGRSPP